MKKGVSPLVASVLLIAMSVLVTGIIFGWIKGFSVERTDEITNRSEGLTECAGSGVAIDDVYLDFPGNKSRVAVRNTGQLSERIVSAQMLNTRGLNATLLGNQTVIIARGEIRIIEFSLNGTVEQCANFSQVRVASLCSSSAFRKTPTNC